MAKTDTRADTLAEVADYLAKWAVDRDMEARQCSPGSDHRNWGLMVAREVANLAEKVRGMA